MLTIDAATADLRIHVGAGNHRCIEKETTVLMQPNCPHCGSPADEVGSHAKSVEMTEIHFRCTNKTCGNAFMGVLTLARGSVPGALNFNLQRSTPGTIETDC